MNNCDKFIERFLERKTSMSEDGHKEKVMSNITQATYDGLTIKELIGVQHPSTPVYIQNSSPY